MKDVEGMHILSSDFLEQVEEFFEIKQSIVLLDLGQLVTLPPDSSSELDNSFRVDIKNKKIPFTVEEQPVPEVSPALKALIDKNLLEIFKYYSKKHLNQKGDFDALDSNKNVLPHSGYVNFCKDFKLPLRGEHITEVFKKSSISNHPHEYEQFNNSITKLGMTMNKAKIAEKKKKMDEIRREQKKRAEPKDSYHKKKKKENLDIDYTNRSVISAPPEYKQKNKFEGRSDAELKYEWNKLFIEMKTLEAIKEEAARM